MLIIFRSIIQFLVVLFPLLLYLHQHYPFPTYPTFTYMTPSSPSRLHLPLASIFLISLTPPSLSLTQSLHHSLSHTQASISRYLPLASTLRPPWLVHMPTSTATPHTPQPSRIHYHASQPPFHVNLPLLPPPHAGLHTLASPRHPPYVA